MGKRINGQNLKGSFKNVSYVCVKNTRQNQSCLCVGAEASTFKAIVKRAVQQKPYSALAETNSSLVKCKFKSILGDVLVKQQPSMNIFVIVGVI